jgi:hypothetical protein
MNCQRKSIISEFSEEVVATMDLIGADSISQIKFSSTCDWLIRHVSLEDIVFCLPVNSNVSVHYTGVIDAMDGTDYGSLHLWAEYTGRRFMYCYMNMIRSFR